MTRAWLRTGLVASLLLLLGCAGTGAYMIGFLAPTAVLFGIFAGAFGAWNAAVRLSDLPRGGCPGCHIREIEAEKLREALLEEGGRR
jgi:hypothetical protein